MKKLLALTTALSLGLGAVAFSVHAEDKAPAKEPAKVEATTTDTTKPVRRAHRKKVRRHAHKKAAVEKEEGKDGTTK